MSTSLAIQKNIQPPPTKTEVVDALVQLRYQAWKEKEDQSKAEIEKLEKAIKKEAFSLAKKRSPDMAVINLSTYNNGRVEVEFTIFPSVLKADFPRYKKLKDSMRSFDEREERRVILSGLNGIKGKRDLLADQETRKKLIGLGTEIGIL